MSSAERVQEILEVAQQLFLSHGVENVSTRLIANAIGISQPALYKHFASKQEILDLLVNRVFAELAETLQNSRLKGAQWVEQALAEYVRFGLKHPDEYRLALISLRGPAGPAKAAITKPPTDTQQLRRTSFRMLEEHVREGMDAGAIRQDLGSSVIVAQCLWAAIHGLVTLQITRPNFPWEDAEQLIALNTRILMKGILSEGRTKAPPADSPRRERG